MKTKKIISVLLAIIMTLGLSTVFVTAADTVTPDYSIANMNKAPKMDGAVYYSEYGAPIITATQADTSGTGKIKFIQGSGVANANQKAMIYMTADENYLYVAAKLDNAKQNGFTTTSALCPQLAVTLSEYDQETNTVPVVDNKETYRAFRILFKKDQTTGTVWSKLYEGTSTSQPPIASEKENETYYANYANGTYTYEMRIAWDTVPGMSGQNYKNGKPFAMTIRLNDAINTGSKACYYQIGGGLPNGTIGTDATPHRTGGYMIVAGGEWCYQNNALADMPTNAPEVDNNVGKDEYGAPIIVTSPQNIYSVTNNSYKNNGASNAQRAKVYMTNDENYLYIAGTLDHAKANSSTITAGRGAQMTVSLSRYDETTANKIHQVNGCDNYLIVRFGFAGESTTSATYTKIFTDNSDEAGTTSINPVGLTLSGNFEGNTYTYEMAIPWSEIPGMEDGVYNGADLAATIRFLDGASTQYDNYYHIGGNAGANLTQANIHATGVLKLTVNDQSTKAVAQVGTTNYGSLDRALDAATSGQTVTLLANAEMDQWTDTVGITLDLDGHILTAKTVSATAPFSKIIDSQDGQGGIQIAKNSDNAKSLQISVDSNEYLPLYDASMNNDAGGYRFFKCTFEHRQRWKEENKKYQFGYVLKMSDAAFALLKDSDSDDKLDADIELVYTISLTVDGVGVHNEVYTFSTKLMTEAASNAAPTLSVTGFEEVGEHTIVLTSSNPMIESSTGVNIVPKVAELALTYSNAQ